MGEFFMGLAGAIGLGAGGVYIALGIVCLAVIAGVSTGVYLHRRKKKLNQGLLSKGKNKIKSKLGFKKDGEFTKTKVRDDKKFNALLEKQSDKVEKPSTTSETKTDDGETATSDETLEEGKESETRSETETVYPDLVDEEELKIEDDEIKIEEGRTL
jgi:hypothetical protein